jgi:hypothetical protein
MSDHRPPLCAHARHASEAIARANRLDPPPKIARLRRLGIPRPGFIVDATDTLATKITLVLPVECGRGRCLHPKVWQP